MGLHSRCGAEMQDGFAVQAKDDSCLLWGGGGGDVQKQLYEVSVIELTDGLVWEVRSRKEWMKDNFTSSWVLRVSDNLIHHIILKSWFTDGTGCWMKQSYVVAHTWNK